MVKIKNIEDRKRENSHCHNKALHLALLCVMHKTFSFFGECVFCRNKIYSIWVFEKLDLQCEV